MRKTVLKNNKTMTNQIILLTGASTGIGRSTALHLDKLGYTVFAGVRRETDGEALRQAASPRLQPIILDVTKPADIANAVTVLTKACGTAGLLALVNNAGYNYNAAFEYTDEAKARQMMEVNFFGLYKMSQAFIPLLRQYAQQSGQRAKLVNIGSIGSISGVPWEAFYHASKFAVLGLTESLRYELHAQRISAVAILPGAIKTDFMPKTDASLTDALDGMPAEGKNRYGKSLAKYRTLVGQATKLGSEPKLVASRIAQAIGAANPRMQYLVGVDAKLFFAIARLLPIGWRHALLRGLFV
jgi:NAD(P)-dependent dehydrogenase (short-subunit alcohol dehydrogenase family)